MGYRVREVDVSSRCEPYHLVVTSVQMNTISEPNLHSIGYDVVKAKQEETKGGQEEEDKEKEGKEKEEEEQKEIFEQQLRL